jgi:hypothetical protein
MRTCGTCTKCCEGYIPADINGYLVFVNNPCNFIKNRSCGIYNDKPSGCNNYKCAWLSDSSIPDWMKPELLGFIVDFEIVKLLWLNESVKHFNYLRVTQSQSEFNNDSFIKVLKYAEDNLYNILWKRNEKIEWSGSKEFSESLNYTINFRDIKLEVW